MPFRTWRAISALLIVIVAALRCSAQTDFEIRNEQARKHNPSGFKFILRTEGGRTTFHLFETIPIELAFSSSRDSTYAIELDEVMNFAGQSDRFQVDPDDTVVLPHANLGRKGAVCCERNRRYLSPRATVLRRELTDYLRFEKSGTYSIFFTTGRVFIGPGLAADWSESTLKVASNVLSLTILPDDPAWDSQRLSETLQKLTDPHVRANYRAMERYKNRLESETERNFFGANRLNGTEYVKAQNALNALDTEEGIRERVRMMRAESKDNIQLERDFGSGTELDQPLLASTVRPALVVAVMTELAREPDFAVEYDFVQHWVYFLLQSEHPELFHPFRDETEHDERFRTRLAYEVKAKQSIVDQLELFLSVKQGWRAEITALTIKTQKANITDLSKFLAKP
jgi:hypothetical protein